MLPPISITILGSYRPVLALAASSRPVLALAGSFEAEVTLAGSSEGVSIPGSYRPEIRIGGDG